MKILAIETSCDETAAAVLQNQRVLSSVISSQIEIHKKYGGVYPEMAARAHLENIIPCIEAALGKAKTKKEKIDTVAVTTGPGLIGSLLVGVNAAKALAYALNKPIIGINHLEGHIYSAFGGEISKLFPALCLIVSGGHTTLVLIRDHGQYKTVGETQDDAAGEAFDKVGKLIGLPYPAGPEIEKLGEKGNPTAFDLPRGMIDQKSYDFSFSGLKTAVLRIIHQMPGIQIKDIRHDLAASFQKAVADVLVSKSVSAALKYGVRSLLVSGGVASNSYLRAELENYLKKLKVKTNLLMPPKNLCTDNAAMIGLASHVKTLENKYSKWYNINAEANQKLINW